MRTLSLSKHRNQTIYKTHTHTHRHRFPPPTRGTENTHRLEQAENGKKIIQSQYKRKGDLLQLTVLRQASAWICIFMRGTRGSDKTPLSLRRANCPVWWSEPYESGSESVPPPPTPPHPKMPVTWLMHERDSKPGDGSGHTTPKRNARRGIIHKTLK